MSCTYEEMRETLSSVNLSNVLEDLKEFTGLSEEEILKRIMRKPRTLEISASGWFDEEYFLDGEDIDEDHAPHEGITDIDF